MNSQTYLKFNVKSIGKPGCAKCYGNGIRENSGDSIRHITRNYDWVGPCYACRWDDFQREILAMASLTDAQREEVLREYGDWHRNHR